MPSAVGCGELWSVYWLFIVSDKVRIYDIYGILMDINGNGGLIAGKNGIYWGQMGYD